MSKQVIVITNNPVIIPNVIKMSLTEFLSSNSHNNAYVLIDRVGITTKEIYTIREHCKEIGLNSNINGFMFDVSYIFIPTWSKETDEEAYLCEVLRVTQYIKECEIDALDYAIDELDKKALKFNLWIDDPLVKRLQLLVKTRTLLAAN